MSKAGRAAIIAATKARWAKFRKQKAAAQKAAAKKPNTRQKIAAKGRKVRASPAITILAPVPS